MPPVGPPAVEVAGPRRRAHRPRADLELVRTLYVSGPWGLAVQSLGALVLLAALLPGAERWRVGVWLGLFAAVSAWRWAVLTRYRAYMAALAAADAAALDAPGAGAVGGVGALGSARRGWDLTVVAGALVWAIGVVLFYPRADTPQQLALTLLSCSVSVAQPVTRFLTYVLCAALAFGSVAACVLWLHGPHHLAVTAVLLLALLVVLMVAWGYRQSFHAMFALQARARAMAAQLAQEKQAAERSRQQAEEAARLRTRFFTAASHDLRQPLHGLGLFVQALGGQPLPVPARAMVQRAVESIDALEAMFDELLDLTRIEQGRLAPAPRAVALAPLAQRLARDLDAVAFDKGVTLRFLGMRGAVQADALMLERVLRNLVVNALRHTDDGGVRVTARRRGPALLLQVWDTGSGVPAAALPHIFDAYWQGGQGGQGEANAPGGAAARSRAGQGLGLAIAKGLAGAMGAVLTVRSQAGRGSVFGLSLPWAEAAAPVPSPLLTLAGRRVVVVSPHAAERAQLAAWLADWSARVEAFADVAAACGAPAAPPDLLVVAQEALPAPPGGAAALAVAFGAAVPTALLADAPPPGAAPGVLAGAEAHVLRRPLQPARLRALAMHLLARGDGGAPLK